MVTQFWSKIDRDYRLFLLATVFIGVGQSVDGSTLTNFLKENLGLMILQRSALEMPRELPGLLVIAASALLAALGDIRMAAVANVLAAVGMLTLGLIPPSYLIVLMTMFVYSLGTHIYLPLANSIGMSFAGSGNLGQKLGQLNAVNNLALVVSSAALWLLFQYFKIPYAVSFAIGAGAFLLAGVCLFMIRRGSRKTANPTRFVFRREYRLYYWLCVLYGGRKQIFITFGPWVLVDILHQPVTTMTALFFVTAIIGIFAKPLIGYWIDTLGEKRILCAEAIGFLVVCLGYSFATDLFGPQMALLIFCACYVLDQTMSAVSMARATYMKKLALVPEDVSPSLSLGISIDHLVTMFLPLLGGYVWYNGGPDGYKYVFMGGAVIALLNFVSALFIRLDAPPREQPGHPAPAARN